MIVSRVTAYLRYLRQARGSSRLSPFVRDLYHSALRPRHSLAEAAPIDAFRRELGRSAIKLAIHDHGAGHHQRGGGHQTVSLGKIARQAACTRRKGERLLRITRFFQPQRMLELGTHLGFSALYQWLGAPNARLITLEGAGSLAYLAREHLNHFGCPAEIIHGPFAETLPALSVADYRPDYVYLDGDHREAPTLSYFEQIVPHMPVGSLVVLDDIYWSEEMARAWRHLSQHPAVSLSIDMYWLGICLIRHPDAKGHHVLW